MAKYQVIFFEKESGEVPVENFINSLDVKMAAKVYRLLVMISENGPELREPYSKHLYFFFVGRRVVVTNGFVKKTQKTPKAEIDKAKAFRKEYIEREELKL